MTNRQKRIALHIIIFLAAAYGSIASYGTHRDFLRLLGGFGIAYAFVILGGLLSDLKKAGPNGHKHPRLSNPTPVDLAYLASPYSNPDPAVMEARRISACRKAGALIQSGIPVVSPIAHNVAILREVGGLTGWDSWRVQDGAMLASCSKLLVLRLAGWQQSKGVAAEIDLANRLGKPVEYLDE